MITMSQFNNDFFSWNSNDSIISYSPVYGNAMDITSKLGDVTYDTNGRIVAARYTKETYIINFNYTVIDGDEVGNANLNKYTIRYIL